MCKFFLFYLDICSISSTCEAVKDDFADSDSSDDCSLNISLSLELLLLLPPMSLGDSLDDKSLSDSPPLPFFPWIILESIRTKWYNFYYFLKFNKINMTINSYPCKT